MEFIFSDLAREFTDDEEKVLCASSFRLAKIPRIRQPCAQIFLRSCTAYTHPELPIVADRRSAPKDKFICVRRRLRLNEAMKEPQKRIEVAERLQLLSQYSTGARGGQNPVNNCYLGKVFLPVEGRHVPSDYSWHRDFEWKGYKGIFSAQEAVSRQRKPGSQWVIHELPACVFHSNGGALIVTEFQPGQPPLIGFELTFPEGYELDSLAEAFISSSRDTVVRLTTSPKQKIPSASFPFYTHHSGDKRLGWERCRQDCESIVDAPFSPALVLLQKAAVWLQRDING